MAKKSIESLYDVLFNMRKLMEDLVQNATGLVNDVNDYGGELNRVVKEQMQKYYIPAIQNLTKDENTPGSIIGIIRFMDSLPLAMTRVEPQVEQVAPVEQPNANIDMPVQSSAAPEDNIPLNTSYENPMPGAAPEAPATPIEQPMAESKIREAGSDKFEELAKWCQDCLKDWGYEGNEPTNDRFISFTRKVALACEMKDLAVLKKLAYDYVDLRRINPVFDDLVELIKGSEMKESCEKKIEESEDVCPDCGKNPCECEPEEMKESITKYSILRKSNKESSLGDDIANLEDKEVCLFDTEEEAQARCDLLNKGVLPEEKDLFGTEYVVEKKEICPEC